MDFLKKFFASFDWKAVVYSGYQGLRTETLVKKVKDSASKWDDMALSSADFLVEHFFGPDKEAPALDAAPVADATGATDAD